MQERLRRAPRTSTSQRAGRPAAPRGALGARTTSPGTSARRSARGARAGSWLVRSRGRRRRPRTAPGTPCAARGVVRGDVEQRAEQRRAQQRLVVAHRVLDHAPPAARVVGGQAQPVARLGRLEAPADDLAAGRGRRARPRRGGAAAAAGVSTPTAPRRRAASRAAGRRAPSRRATSSIRSASRVTSLRRQCGTVDVEAVVGARPTPKPSALEVQRALRARDVDAEQPAARARRAAGSPRGVGPGPPTSIVPGTSARAGQLEHQLRRDGLRLQRLLGRQPLLEARAGLGAQAEPRDVRWMFGPSQLATSISTRVVSSWTSERAPPMTPAIDVGPSASAISTMSGRACASGRRA